MASLKRSGARGWAQFGVEFGLFTSGFLGQSWALSHICCLKMFVMVGVGLGLCRPW